MQSSRWIGARIFAVFAAATASRDVRAADGPTFADRADAGVDDANHVLAFMFNPLPMAVGVFGGEVDVAWTERLATAAELAAVRRGGATYLAYGAGLLLFPFRSAFHGLVLEPRVIYLRPLSQPLSRVADGTDSLDLGGSAAWQWTWDYGLSIRAGAGVLWSIGGPGAGMVGVGAPALAVSVGGVGALAISIDGSLGWAF